MPPPAWLITVRRPESGMEGGPTPVKDGGDYVGVPQRFEARVLRDFVGEASFESWPLVLITMQIELQDWRPVIRKLSITSEPEPHTAEDRGPKREGKRAGPTGAAITAELLRRLPLSRLARYATLGAAVGFGEGPVVEQLESRLRRDDTRFLMGAKQDGDYNFSVTDLPASREVWSEFIESIASHSEDSSLGKRRNRVTDELLQRVAAVYRQAVADRRPPKKAVQATERVSEATAGRYIMRARERGYLGRTVRGKKGEIRE